MNKTSVRNDDFHEDLTSQESLAELAKQKAPSRKTLGLSEDQLVKLSDDLRCPMKNPSSATNPMQ